MANNSKKTSTTMVTKVTMFIREANLEDVHLLAMLIREANRDVAVKFGLNANNCPKHPSFCTDGWITADLARGERYFILDDGSQPIGCVAFENPSAGIAYLNRLSVLPTHRNQGAGTRLVQHIFALAKATGIENISIGVIGEHFKLQCWYRKIGFQEGESKRFSHLPFSVKYMSSAVTAAPNPDKRD